MNRKGFIHRIQRLFRHEWNGCVCTICGKTRHDFRNADGANPKSTGSAGVFPCVRCGAEFYRVITPPKGCGDCTDCDGNGWISGPVSYCSGHELVDEKKCPYYEENHQVWCEEWIVRPDSVGRENYHRYPAQGY